LGVAIVVPHRHAVTALVLIVAQLTAGLARGDEGADVTEELPPPPLEFLPYRVTCLVAHDPNDVSSAASAARLAYELPQWVARGVGGRWTLATTLLEAPEWAVRGGLHQLTPDEPGNFQKAESADTIYHVVVRRDVNRFCVDLRAWEPLFGHLSPVRTVATLDVRELAAETFTAMQELFRPRAQWERQDDQTVRLRIQAGALSAGDSPFPVARPAEVFAPWMVFRNREREIQKVQELPWTFFVLSQAEDGRGTGQLVSGLRSPLGAKPRGRIELVAVAIRPQWADTDLQVAALSKPPRPLPAHRVEVTPVQLGDAPQAVAEPPAAWLTDREGHVRLPREAEPRLQWLRVTSGDLLLAKVPLMPGAVAAARLELPDDSLRLLAEGQLKILQADLVSVVAQRSAFMAAARSEAKKQNWENAKRCLRQLDALPSAQSFREQVSAVRVPAVAEARQRRDRVAEQRINRLCNETEELIQRYLVNDKVKELKEELADLEAALKVE